MFKRLNLRNENGIVDPVLQEHGDAQEDDEVQPVDPKETDPHEEIPRFELDAEDKDSAWTLPESQLSYLHKYMKIHVSDKDINDHL